MRIIEKKRKGDKDLIDRGGIDLLDAAEDGSHGPLYALSVTETGTVADHDFHPLVGRKGGFRLFADDFVNVFPASENHIADDVCPGVDVGSELEEGMFSGKEKGKDVLGGGTF